MKSKTSLYKTPFNTSIFKAALIKGDIKRFWWISALYTIILLFILPINHYMQSINIENLTQLSLEGFRDYISGELTMAGGSSYAVLLVVPVVIGTLVFSFMQRNSSVSLYLSLPVKRSTLYFSSSLSAFILLAVPMAITSIVMLLLSFINPLALFYTPKLIFTWLAYSLLFGSLFLVMSIFVGMFTGNPITQIAFVYILNILPIFLFEFIGENLEKVLFGFNTSSYAYNYRNLPMAKLFEFDSEGLSGGLVAAYLVTLIVLFVIGLYAFKLRRPESAGDIISFNPIKPIFIYGVTACAALLSGSYFMHAGRATLSFALFGYFLGSIIAYVIVQMITRKSLNILNTYKGYLAFVVVAVILIACAKLDIIGYENRIPDPDQVAEVYMGHDINWWRNKDKSYSYNEGYESTRMGLYKKPENIRSITRLHTLIVNQQSENGRRTHIGYKLKNGKHIIRYYPIDTELYAAALAPIYENSEYKQARYPIVSQEPDEIKYIELNGFSDNHNEEKFFIISDNIQIASFKIAITKDIENLNYTDMVSGPQRIITAGVVDSKDRYILYDIKTNLFANTIDWLVNTGIYREIALEADQ
jgi:ABC-2 type transport system permease protein